MCHTPLCVYGTLRKGKWRSNLESPFKIRTFKKNAYTANEADAANIANIAYTQPMEPTLTFRTYMLPTKPTLTFRAYAANIKY